MLCTARNGRQKEEEEKVIILLVMLSVVLAVIGAYRTGYEIYSRKTYALPVSKARNYTLPSREILKEYNALPDTNKPYSNITYLLTALDVKYDKDKVNRHFVSSSEDPGGWRCSCARAGKRSCIFQEYFELKAHITAVKKAVKNQEHVVAMLGVQDGIDAIGQFKEDLARELNLINETTQELSRKQITGG